MTDIEEVHIEQMQSFATELDEDQMMLDAMDRNPALKTIAARLLNESFAEIKLAKRREETENMMYEMIEDEGDKLAQKLIGMLSADKALQSFNKSGKKELLDRNKRKRRSRIP